jgi:hypothetical protein
MVTTHRLDSEPNRNGGRDVSRRHHRLGVGHSESTPLETVLPARIGGSRRRSVKKYVVERGSPSLNEAAARLSREG